MFIFAAVPCQEAVSHGTDRLYRPHVVDVTSPCSSVCSASALGCFVSNVVGLI
jgi:hypothetical protein